MAVTLSITVTNAQGQRVAAALGHAASATDPTWVNATQAEVEQWVKRQIRRMTLDYENRRDEEAARLAREAEQW